MNKMEWLDRIDSDEAQIVELCRRLVQIPSENPPGDKREMVQFLKSLFDSKGLDYQIYAPESTKPNFLACIKGGNSGKRLVLNGHIDTVSAGDRKAWEHDPFSGDVEQGRIYGRAASNMKGGDVASIMAFLYLSENIERIRGEAVLALVSDDEAGGEWGVIWMLDNVGEMRGDAVLNGGPSGCRFVNFAEKGPIWMSITSEGKASLAAYPHLGVNAVHNMMDFLSQLRKLQDWGSLGEIAINIEEGREALDEEKGAGTTDALLRVTVSVGVISGGYKINHVPDECRAEVDIRIPPGVKASEILGEIERMQSMYPGIRYACSIAEDPGITSLSEEIVQLAVENAKLTQGQRVFLGCGLGFTSCRYFRSRGIPCAVYGPQPNHIGEPNEYVLVRDLMDTVKVHTLTALDYLRYFRS
jgi:succinyl-diaminopimelate desuccinylase